MSDPKMQASTNPITELKATAHLMTMEDGLFCVFNTPGSVPPDAATGLPGVRITAAPGQGGFPGTVGISGFNTEGWLGGDAGAALVRVTGGPAQVLVTVYQSAEGGHDAPKLQVIRLSEQPAAAPEVESPAPAQEPPGAQTGAGEPIEVAAHIYGRGDVGGRLGDWMGEPGSKRWIEGFGLAPSSGIGSADIEYQAVLGRGWLSPWAVGGQFCGSRGMSLPILGLRVRLRGDAASAHTAVVSATFVDGTRIGGVSDGSAVEAPSLSPLEAFQIMLVPAGAAPAGTRQPVRAAKPGKKPAGSAVPASAPAPVPAGSAAKPRRAKAAASAAPPAPARSQRQAKPAAEPEQPDSTSPAKPGAKAPAKRKPATTRRR
ncbi:MAG TPA: hypothetical protein VGC15_18755 [Acetobacteraceae bacterium]